LSKHTVIDFLSRNESHLNFNLTFLKGLESLNYDVCLISNQTQIQRLEATNKVSFKDSPKWAKRSFNGFLKLLKHRTSRITILAADNYVVPILLFLFFPLFKKSKITFILHNNIGPLSINPKKRIPLKLVSKVLSIKLICLTQDGLQEVQKIGFEKQAVLIPHFNFSHLNKIVPDTSLKLKDNKSNILLIGRQANLFISKTLPQLNLNEYPNLHFTVCSTITTSSKYDNLELITDRLNENEFDKHLELTDFALFPNYNIRFRASGILLDCISKNCAIIAPREGHFKEYIDNSIGEFYNDINELKTALNKINKSQIKRSNYPANNFKKALDKSSFESFKQKINDYYSTI
jgi:hypothetical protein